MPQRTDSLCFRIGRNMESALMKRSIRTLAAGVLGLVCGLSSAVAAPVGPPINPADAQMRVTIGNQSFDNIVLNWVAAQDEKTGGTVYSLTGGPITLSPPATAAVR
jgi:hypothetical protein